MWFHTWQPSDTFPNFINHSAISEVPNENAKISLKCSFLHLVLIGSWQYYGVYISNKNMFVSWYQQPVFRYLSSSQIKLDTAWFITADVHHVNHCGGWEPVATSLICFLTFMQQRLTKHTCLHLVNTLVSTCKTINTVPWLIINCSILALWNISYKCVIYSI